MKCLIVVYIFPLQSRDINQKFHTLNPPAVEVWVSGLQMGTCRSANIGPHRFKTHARYCQSQLSQKQHIVNCALRSIYAIYI